ncbi:MAG: winged helix-turn-helix transcriptional regulator [Planctomycetes bacterium]|nr:winged helix-turn-helix transcriptional regulator [Planctomycetota bacterium]
MNDQEENIFAELAKALGHPARLRIMSFLAKQKTCICSPIVEEIGLAQSTVSQHLKILKETGWIQGTVEGNKVCYCLNPETIDLYHRYSNTFFTTLK